MTRSCLLVLLVMASLGGCLRPGEERAQRDLAVGQAEGERFGVQVADGLATVHALSDSSLSLWAGAPSVAMTLQSHRDREQTIALAIDNVMPDAALTVTAGDAQVQAEPAPRATERRYRVTLPAGANVTLALAIPDATVTGPFRIAVLSDVQDAIDRVQDIFQDINRSHAERPIAFLLGAGDLTHRGRPSELARFQTELDALDIPYYTTLGNHELAEEPSHFHRFFGRGSFSFDHRGARFTLIDSASASLDPLVYDALSPWLQGARDGMHIVATHIPPVDPVGVRNGSFASRNEAAKLLAMLAAANVDLTLYGHIHSHYAFVNAGIQAHISGGGGAIPERFDGLGRHYLLVDIDPEHQTSAVQIAEVGG